MNVENWSECQSVCFSSYIEGLERIYNIVERMLMNWTMNPEKEWTSIV